MGTRAETILMPMLAVRGLVVFPNTVVHFDVSRERSELALKAAIFNAVADFVVGFMLGALVTNFDRILPWLLSLF